MSDSSSDERTVVSVRQYAHGDNKGRSIDPPVVHFWRSRPVFLGSREASHDCGSSKIMSMTTSDTEFKLNREEEVRLSKYSIHV